MKYYLLFALILLFSCSENEPSPVIKVSNDTPLSDTVDNSNQDDENQPDSDSTKTYNDLLGTWELRNSRVTIKLDIIKDPYHANSDTLYPANISVKYLNKITFSPFKYDKIWKMNFKGGKYDFYFQTNIEDENGSAGNVCRLYNLSPNSTFTELTSETNSDELTWTNSWISVVYYDGTYENQIIFFKPPITFKRIK